MLAQTGTEYTENDVALSASFAACNINYYKYDIHWEALPGLRPPFQRILHALMSRRMPNQAEYLTTVRSGSYTGLGDPLPAPMCAVVAHNNWYKMRLKALLPGEGYNTWVYFISNEIAATPVRCISSQ